LHSCGKDWTAGHPLMINFVQSFAVPRLSLKIAELQAAAVESADAL